MTIEQILQLPAKELEAITDKEWEEYFKPYLPIVRPESLVPKPKESYRAMSERKASTKQQAQEILAQYGFNYKL